MRLQSKAHTSNSNRHRSQRKGRIERDGGGLFWQPMVGYRWPHTLARACTKASHRRRRRHHYSRRVPTGIGKGSTFWQAATATVLIEVGELNYEENHPPEEISLRWQRSCGQERMSNMLGHKDVVRIVFLLAQESAYAGE